MFSTSISMIALALRRCVLLFLLPFCALAHVEKVTYYYTDPQGNVLAEADEQGNIIRRADFSAYGRSMLDGPQNGPGFAGQMSEPDSGLIYMKARYYDPDVGRFLSVDPVRPTVGDTFSFGRYTYASNSPVVNIDPLGMSDCPAQSSDASCPDPQNGPLPENEVTQLPVITVTSTAPVRPVTLPEMRVVAVPLFVIRATAAGLYFVDSNSFNEMAFGQHSCYGSISCGKFSNVVFNRPPGVWPADKGAMEWGRRTGVGADEAKRRFHKIKQGSGAHSGGAADWGVNPETGDVYDPSGEVHDNLGE